jgi:hypothetical protein
MKTPSWDSFACSVNAIRVSYGFPMGFLEIAYECKGESYGGCCSKEGVSGGGAFVSSCRETA